MPEPLTGAGCPLNDPARGLTAIRRIIDKAPEKDSREIRQEIRESCRLHRRAKEGLPRTGAVAGPRQSRRT